MKQSVVLVLALVLAGAVCSTVAAQSSLTLAGQDDAAAAKMLLDWLRNRGFTVEALGTSSLRYTGNFKFQLSPKLSAEGIDRLIVTVLFGIQDSYRGKDVVVRKVNAMNQAYNIGTFSIDSDGDLWVQAFITFVNYIDEAEIRNFLKWFDASVLTTIVGDAEFKAMVL